MANEKKVPASGEIEMVEAKMRELAHMISGLSPTAAGFVLEHLNEKVNKTPEDRRAVAQQQAFLEMLRMSEHELLVDGIFAGIYSDISFITLRACPINPAPYSKAEAFYFHSAEGFFNVSHQNPFDIIDWEITCITEAGLNRELFFVLKPKSHVEGTIEAFFAAAWKWSDEQKRAVIAWVDGGRKFNLLLDDPDSLQIKVKPGRRPSGLDQWTDITIDGKPYHRRFG